MEQNKAERLNENVTEKMCSSDGNVVGKMCSPADADTCGDGSSDAVLWKIRKIGMLNHKMLWFEGENWSKK